MIGQPHSTSRKNPDGTVTTTWIVPVIFTHPAGMTLAELHGCMLGAIDHFDEEARRKLYRQGPPLIEFVDGGFRFRMGPIIDLNGKRLHVLKMFVRSRHTRLSAADLRELVWDRDPVDDQTIKVTVNKVREALRKALRQAKKKVPKDPLACIDDGPNLAWGLNLP